MIRLLIYSVEMQAHHSFIIKRVIKFIIIIIY